MAETRKRAHQPGVTQERGLELPRLAAIVSGSVGLGVTGAALSAGLAVPAALVGAIAAYYMSRSDGAQYVSLKWDPGKVEFSGAVEVAAEHARTGYHVLEIGIRRTDYPGHPWVCEWKRTNPSEPWRFEWMAGASSDLRSGPEPMLPIGVHGSTETGGSTGVPPR